MSLSARPSGQSLQCDRRADHSKAAAPTRQTQFLMGQQAIPHPAAARLATAAAKSAGLLDHARQTIGIKVLVNLRVLGHAVRAGKFSRPLREFFHRLPQQGNLVIVA